MTTCTYCHRPAPRGTDHHDACLEAHGLDHDPQSEEEARTWLDDRRMLLTLQPPLWTCRAYTPVMVENGRWSIGIVQLDRPGYILADPSVRYGLQTTAVAESRRLNEAIGVGDEDAARIAMGCLAARPVVETVRYGGEVMTVPELFARHGAVLSDLFDRHRAAGPEVALLLAGTGAEALRLEVDDQTVLLERLP